ncbi:MAG: IS4 family transposase [Anaerolineae bacterium]|nr:IS4 family transposase [Anaerolineae bacterium]
MAGLKVIVGLCVGLSLWLVVVTGIEAKGLFGSDRPSESQQGLIRLKIGPQVGLCQTGWPVEAQSGTGLGAGERWSETISTGRRRVYLRRRQLGGRRARRRDSQNKPAQAEVEASQAEVAARSTEPGSAVAMAPLLNDQAWAEQQWGQTELGDQRRTNRAVRLGARMAAHPAGSIPDQMGSPAETKGAYRLLNKAVVTLTKLCQPHWQQTRQAAEEHPVVLMLQDTTEMDFTGHRQTKGLGPIGDGRGRGFLLHAVLAFVPTSETILGLAHLQAVLRKARSKKKRKPKWMRTPEALVWKKASQAVGQPGPGSQWVHVGDRGSDSFEFMVSCRDQPGVHFLLRLARNRVLDWSWLPTEPAPADEPVGPTERYLLDYARGLPAQGQSFTVKVSARKGEAKRQATLRLAWAQVQIPVPQEGPKELRQHQPFTAWVVRAWEPQAPAGVKKPLEWVLLSSLPVSTWAQARQRVQWYAYRWLIEEYFRALKTGCRIEAAQFDHRADLQRLLGFLAIVAVRLLQVRQLARQTPDTPALSLVDPLEVRILAAQLKTDPTTMTLAYFWQGVAQLGGHQGRQADGPPGWITIWRGRRKLQLLVDGARLLLDTLPSDQTNLSILLANPP